MEQRRISESNGQPPIADAELMRRFQQGDRSSFEELVRRWQQPIGRFLARLIGSTTNLQDLCQEVFLRLYQAGTRYREQGNFSTWLYSIALNIGRDAARRTNRETVLPMLPTKEQAPPTDAICERRELASVIEVLLEELPAVQREVLILRHYEEMSFEEMSRLLATPASTLKSRFTTALNHLRRRLPGLGWNREDAP